MHGIDSVVYNCMGVYIYPRSPDCLDLESRICDLRCSGAAVHTLTHLRKEFPLGDTTTQLHGTKQRSNISSIQIVLIDRLDYQPGMWRRQRCSQRRQRKTTLTATPGSTVARTRTPSLSATYFYTGQNWRRHRHPLWLLHTPLHPAPTSHQHASDNTDSDNNSGLWAEPLPAHLMPTPSPPTWMTQSLLQPTTTLPLTLELNEPEPDHNFNLTLSPILPINNLDHSPTQKFEIENNKTTWLVLYFFE